MTDNEIIKGLLNCINGRCESCFFFDESDKVTSCEEVGMKYALDLINRQKAEILELQKRIINWRKDMDYRPEQIKAEAYKEFAERLKAKSVSLYKNGEEIVSAIPITKEDVDNLVKEMVGED